MTGPHRVSARWRSQDQRPGGGPFRRRATPMACITVRRPGFMHASLRLKIMDRVVDGLTGSVVLGLDFGRRPSAEAVHEPAGVVPVHPGGGDLPDVGQGFLRPVPERRAVPGAFGFVETYGGFRQGSVSRAAEILSSSGWWGSRRRLRAGTRQAGSCGPGRRDRSGQPSVPSISWQTGEHWGRIWVMPGEERKLATVLFADLVGLTELAGGQDPERVRAMLDRFYDAMAAEVERAGGRSRSSPAMR